MDEKGYELMRLFVSKRMKKEFIESDALDHAMNFRTLPENPEIFPLNQ